MSVILNARQAVSLAYLLHQYWHVEPFAELDGQDIRCGGGDYVRVLVLSNSTEERFASWSQDVFISEDASLWFWIPDVPFDPDDVGTWLEGHFEAFDRPSDEDFYIREPASGNGEAA